jgi:hypothetical protein
MRLHELVLHDDKGFEMSRAQCVTVWTGTLYTVIQASTATAAYIVYQPMFYTEYTALIYCIELSKQKKYRFRPYPLLHPIEQ